MREVLVVVVVCVMYAAVGQPYTLSASSPNVTPTTEDAPCRLWQSKEANGSCKCHIGENFYVACEDDPYYLGVYQCYCVTERQGKQMVSPCLYTCHSTTHTHLNITAHSMAEINEEVCGPYNREGAMCARCKPNHSPPVYSYSLHCVNCTSSNWGKFLAVSLLPSTAFFVLVLLFRISATSPNLNGFIFFCQILTSANTMRLLQVSLADPAGYTQGQRIGVKLFASLVGVWNLDFLRLVYTPFCLQPGTDNFMVMATDYLAAVYPLLLIVLAYILVLTYDGNVRVVVRLCRPFVSFFIKFRREWNIRYSLVDAFATFLLLSYVKILSVSIDILLPTLFYRYHHNPEPLVSPFWQANVPYFGSNHFPFACLAVFFLLTFTLLPMLLLLLYPCSCFQVCLNRTGCHCQALHIFMDAFQGHYKNGTDGTHDLRYFSGIYLLIRGLVYLSTALAYHISSYGYTTLVLFGFTAIFASARPFKKFRYNLSDVYYLSITAMLYVSLIPFSFDIKLVTQKALIPFSFVLIAAAVLYNMGLFLSVIVTSRVVVKCWNSLKQQLRALPGSRFGYENLLSP